MKRIKSVDAGSFALFSAVLMGLWTLVYGVVYWVLGWIFGATSWWIDMNLGSWSVYTLSTLVLVLGRALIVGIIGALAGAIVAWVYNLVARAMGGIRLYLQ